MALLKFDLTGNVYGRLTVIERFCYNGKKACVKWLCKCSCGKVSIVSSVALSSGKMRGTRSCGCLVYENKGKPIHGHTRYGTLTSEYIAWMALNQGAVIKTIKTIIYTVEGV